MSDEQEQKTLRQQYERRARVNGEQCEFMDCPACGALLAIFTADVPPTVPVDEEPTVAN